MAAITLEPRPNAGMKPLFKKLQSDGIKVICLSSDTKLMSANAESRSAIIRYFPNDERRMFDIKLLHSEKFSTTHMLSRSKEQVEVGVMLFKNKQEQELALSLPLLELPFNTGGLIYRNSNKQTAKGWCD